MRGNRISGMYNSTGTGTIPAHTEMLLTGAIGYVEGGSIPARAGEPKSVNAVVPLPRVYPRACGGTWRGIVKSLVVAGSIPARAGEPKSVNAVVQRFRGSIPARAGEPGKGCKIKSLLLPWSIPGACGGTVGGLHPPREPRVYPRACGGTGVAYIEGACRTRVYPRACGGTVFVEPLGGLLGEGLSPRVRGEPSFAPTASMPLGGSIPARAGEPFSSIFTGSTRRVYPRACGGTAPDEAPAFDSCPRVYPRVRGNHPSGTSRGDVDGSIPARAGEP